MRLAIASGKGGTGKTTVTAALSEVWPEPVFVADLDVEAPNLHLYLRPELGPAEPVELEVPRVDEEACTGCGACADACQFSAIAMLGGAPQVFADMCHGCGGCFLACPASALRSDSRCLGEVRLGTTRRGQPFAAGRQRVGEAMSTPIIGRLTGLVQEGLTESMHALMDAPPGVSCPAMAAAEAADVVLLVVEPTPFGLHDLRLAVAAFAQLERPLAAVVNRADLGDRGVERFLDQVSIPVLARIPYDPRWAERHGRGQPITAGDDVTTARFVDVADRLLKGGAAAPALPEELRHV